MSIWFMFDNHTFRRLDGKSLAQALAELEVCVQQDGGMGFIGCEGEHGDAILSWEAGQPYQERARKLLVEAMQQAGENNGGADEKHM